MKRGCFAALALLLLVSPASAADPPAQERVRLASLLKAGADAAKAKRWEACIEALTEAAAIDGAAKIRGELGLCEESAGRVAPAYGDLLRARDGAPPDERNREPWARYLTALKRVKDRVAFLFITTDPPNASVILDGRPIGVVDGSEIAVEPGTHTIAAKLEGYGDAVQTRSMSAGDVPHVQLTLTPKPRAASPAATAAASVKSAPVASAPVAPLRRPSSGGSWLTPSWSVRGGLLVLTYASATAALAGGATWLGLEVARSDLHSGLADDACDPAQPSVPSKCIALHDRLAQRQIAMQFTTGAAIAAGVFGVATGLAIYLDRSPLRPSVALSASPEGGGFIVSGAW